MSNLACPFCGKPVDLEDDDTLYPSGIAWVFDKELQLRTYHRRMFDYPKDQWCYVMHCVTSSGGCNAEMHGDSKEEVLEKWNRRSGK